MNKLLSHRIIVQQNLMTLIGVCLCFYFSYHAVQGERSLLTLMSLRQEIATVSQKSDILQGERMALESKVVMLRPGSLSRDLLEERVRFVLGYKYKDEVTIPGN